MSDYETVLFLTLPEPSGRIAGNNRGSWHGTHKARKAARSEAKLLALSEINRGFIYHKLPLDAVEIDIHWFGWALVDPDNIIARCKPYLDGLVDAGVMPDDSSKHVKRLSVEEVEIDRQNRRVELVVRKAGA